PRVPLLSARPSAGGGPARLPAPAAPRGGRAGGGLPRRAHAHELRPPALRLRAGGSGRARGGMRRLILALLVLAPAPAAAFAARDMLGHPLTLAAPPQRIVSLVPSATEIIFALGGEDRLVGVTDFCDWPRSEEHT